MAVRISILIFILVLIFPNSVPGLGADNGRRIASILLVLFGTVALLYKGIHINRKSFVLAALLFLQVIWVIIVTALTTYLEPGNITYGNFTEILRILAILVFYLLGSSISPYMGRSDFAPVVKVILIVTFMLAVFWVFESAITDFFSSFYIVRGGRFSGLVPSVNYIWVPTLLAILFALHIYNNDHNRSRWLLLIGTLLVAILSLLLSSSNTSFIAIIIGIMAYIFWSAESKKRVLKYYFTAGCVFILIAYLTLGLLQNSTVFDRGVDRFVNLYLALASTDLSQIQSFSNRLDLWGRAVQEIFQSPIIGHGTSKIDFRIIDNNYLTTIYRFGIVGFILEMLFYLTSLFLFHKRNQFNKIYALPLSFIIAFMAAGITTATFYELKSPYILSFIIGVFATAEIWEKEES